MTVSYTADVANASAFGCFTKILLRWKGSVYKLIFKELAAYLCLYFLFNTVYRSVLCTPGHEWSRHVFESMKAYCQIQMSSIPMTFGLGFYVSLIVKRWWDQYRLLPWPDSLALFMVGLLKHRSDLQKEKEEARTMRRNVMRYIILSYVIALRRISLRVRKRFPTNQEVVEIGLLRSDELKQMEALNDKCSVSKWWMPLVWATNIIEQARSDGKINNDPGVQTILNEISAIRKGLTEVQYFDTISVPLVYTQVVTLAVYTYFGAALMGAQWVAPQQPEEYSAIYKLPAFMAPETNDTTAAGGDGEAVQRLAYQPLDLYVPVFLILQFIFYVGWLKVAETLINPFGEDDDDFELNYLIDRHMQVSYMIVDDMQEGVTKEKFMHKDMHYDQLPLKLPYTDETAHYRKDEPKGSAEVLEEADNLSHTYYKLIPFGRSGEGHKHRRSSHMSVNIAAALVASGNAAVHVGNAATPAVGSKIGDVHDPSSEYESIDPTFFNFWRRGKHSQRGSIDATHAAGGHVGPGYHQHHQPGARRKMSQDRKSVKSFKSQRSIYAKLSSRFNKSMRGHRDNSKLIVADSSAAVEAGGTSPPNELDLDLEPAPAADEEQHAKPPAAAASSAGPAAPSSSNDEDTDHNHVLEGQPAQLDILVTAEDGCDSAEDGGSCNPGGVDDSLLRTKLMADHLRNMSHLSTITEQNSPYSTNPGSRRSSKTSSYPTAKSLFAGNSPETASRMLQAKLAAQPSESESNAYYPLDSDVSSHTEEPSSAGPNSRFCVEEVPNYEPVLFQQQAHAHAHAQAEAGPPAPGAEHATDTDPEAPKLLPLAPPTATAAPAAAATRESPALPKRHPVMSLRPLAQPSLVSSDVDGGQQQQQQSKSLDLNETKSKDEDASSAFNSATYYV